MRIDTEFGGSPHIVASVKKQHLVHGRFSDVIRQEIVISDIYDGEYIIIPSMQQNTLRTKNKTLTEDIMIKEIPTYEVSNNAGGETFVLVKEEYDGNK